MRPDDLADALTPERFRPFVITVSTGETFRVTHPDQVVVGRSSVAVGTQRRDGRRFYERIVTLALVHVVSLTPIEETPVS